MDNQVRCIKDRWLTIELIVEDENGCMKTCLGHGIEAIEGRTSKEIADSIRAYPLEDMIDKLIARLEMLKGE